MKLNYDLRKGMTVKVRDTNITVFDENGNEIYCELSNGYWSETVFDGSGNMIHYKNSTGYWWKQEYNDKGNEIYYENSSGFFCKREYDSQGNEIYYENSNGKIIDNRPKPKLTKEECDFLKCFRDMNQITIYYDGGSRFIRLYTIETVTVIGLSKLKLEFKGLKNDELYNIYDLEVEK